MTYTTEVSSAEHADALPRNEGTLHFPSGCDAKDIVIEVPDMPGVSREGLQLAVVLTGSSGADLLRRKRTCTVNVPRQVRHVAAQTMSGERQVSKCLSASTIYSAFAHSHW